MSDSFWMPLIVALLAAIAACCALLLHKVRRIHLMQYQIASDASDTRIEAHSLYRQIESLSALNQLLRLEQPLPPLRGWAGSPDFLLTLARHTLQAKPLRMLECSSGSSTLTLARCAQLNGRGHVFSLEHDPAYAAATRRELQARGLADWATVVDAPLVKSGAHKEQPWYSIAGLPQDAGPFDLLVIDGPPKSTAERARQPALPVLWPLLSADCVTFLDDADRPDERAAVDAWLKQFPQLQQQPQYCEKGCVRLERKIAMEA